MRPATTNGLSARACKMLDPSSISSTSNKRNNFDSITIGEGGQRIARAGHNLQIALNRDLATVQTQLTHQIGDAALWRYVAGFTIDCQLQHRFR